MKKNTANHIRSEWFHQAGWGLFMHFLALPPGNGMGQEISIADWNRQVDSFDVEILAQQLHQINAGYFFITIGQNSGFFCAPNYTYDRLTGRAPEQSRCSRRDLVADLYNALAKYKIPLLVYLPSHAPMGDDVAVATLRCVPPWDFSCWTTRKQDDFIMAVDPDPRLKTFQRNWENIIREWSMRWGKNVHGWWFDGCYYANRLFDFPNEPNFASCAAAVRAGNPKSLVAWNPGIGSPRTISNEEDYTSGEVNEPNQIQCFGRWRKQAQFHMLTYLGRTWGAEPLRFSATQMEMLTRNITDNGGVVTWDIPYNHADGTIKPELFSLLRDFSKRMETPRKTRLPPVPVISVKNPLVPLGLDGVRTIALILDNPQETMIAGQIDLAMEPTDAFACLEPLNFTLGPGEMSCHNIHIHQIVSAGMVANSILRTRCSGVEQRFVLPCPQLLEDPQPDTRYPLYDAMGQVRAEIGLGFTDDRKLRFAGTIFDLQVKTQPRPWEGSGLEVFLAEVGKPTERTQFFLVPADCDTSAQVLYWQNKTLQHLPGACINTGISDKGYELFAELPLPGWKLADGIMLELQLTVNSSQGYCRGCLFGSSDPFNSSSCYFSLKPRTDK